MAPVQERSRQEERSSARRTRNPDIGNLIGLALWRWARSSPRRFVWSGRRAWYLGLAECRRVQRQRKVGGSIPWVVAVSPTMRCNYGCAGCYSRGRPTDGELSAGELGSLFSEAEELGVLAIVLTGGEPLLRDGLLAIAARHQRLLFVLITNGSLVTAETARRIAESGNVIPLVSLEGLSHDTDERRHAGAYEAALAALVRFRDAGACFGFAAMNTAVNTDRLGGDEFIGRMAAVGCALGFVTEYIPCGTDPRPDWLLSEGARSAFRRRVLDLRKSQRMVLIQFPHDEYGEENRCSAAGRASLHIGSRGEVEPCPFVPIARENVREGGLIVACRSPFLRAIRERPELLTRERLGCSLFEHRAELEALAQQLGGSGRVK